MRGALLRPVHWANSRLETAFPELRIFLRSDSDTRFISLPPLTQAIGWAGSVLLLVWTVIVTAMLFMGLVGSGSQRDQALKELRLYEERLDSLSNELNVRSAEARQTQERFSTALEQVSLTHSALLASEDRRRELETSLKAIQATLRRAMNERDAARESAGSALASATGAGATSDVPALDADSLEFLTSALLRAADDRDARTEEVTEARRAAASAAHDLLLLEQKTNRIFSQLEEAVSASMESLEKVFSAAGLSSETILNTVRGGYSGQGGPLTPIIRSSGEPQPDFVTIRAVAILEKLDRINRFRRAIEKVPLSMPIKGRYRRTSGFGPRWGRMHYGLDFAAEYGKPIYATADGMVSFAGWNGDYGRLVRIRHEFGIETRYAHLAKIRVKSGQRVSQGERIGDMGNSGRSTGTHLHYEIRVGGKPINPMIYIKASGNVF